MTVEEYGVADLSGTKSHLNYRPCASSGFRAKTQFFFLVAISPSSSGSVHCPGFKIELRHTHTHTQSVGLLPKSDKPDTETST